MPPCCCPKSNLENGPWKVKSAFHLNVFKDARKCSLINRSSSGRSVRRLCESGNVSSLIVSRLLNRSKNKRPLPFENLVEPCDLDMDSSQCQGSTNSTTPFVNAPLKIDGLAELFSSSKPVQNKAGTGTSEVPLEDCRVVQHSPSCLSPKVSQASIVSVACSQNEAVSYSQSPSDEGDRGTGIVTGKNM